MATTVPEAIAVPVAIAPQEQLHQQQDYCDHHQDEYVETTTKLMQKMIALNHAGVRSMESNKIQAAVKIFTAAFHAHEQLKAKITTRRYTATSSTAPSSTTTTTTLLDPRCTAVEGGSSSNQQQQQQQPTHGNVNVNDFFYRHRRSSSSSSSSSRTGGDSTSSASLSSSLSEMPTLEEALELDDRRRQRRNKNHHTSREGNHQDRNETSSIDDELIFRDSIRLPFLEDYFPSSSSLTSFWELPVRQQQVDPAFTFLSTCHALNLAIAHHLRGIEVLHSEQQQRRRTRLLAIAFSFSREDDTNNNDDDDDDANAYYDENTSYEGDNSYNNKSATTANSSSSLKHFERAGRLYELTMRIERTRSMEQQRQKQQQQKQHSTPHPDSSSSNNDHNDDHNHNKDKHTTDDGWCSLQIVLACLNNLGHVHSVTHKYYYSQRCYQQLQATAQKLLFSRAPHQLVKLQQQQQQQQQYNTTTTNNSSIHAEYAYSSSYSYSSYLEMFWMNASRGLLRLQQQQQQYVTKKDDKGTAISTTKLVITYNI